MPKLQFNQKCVVCNHFSPLNTFHWQHTHDKIQLYISHLFYDAEMCKKAFIVHYKNETHNDLKSRKIDWELFLHLWNDIEVHRLTCITLLINISWISEHIHIIWLNNGLEICRLCTTLYHYQNIPAYDRTTKQFLPRTVLLYLH